MTGSGGAEKCPTASLVILSTRLEKNWLFPRVEASGEQHRKSVASVPLAAANPQFTADPFDQRSYNPHS
jgi:putative heme iron utilization protein